MTRFQIVKCFCGWQGEKGIYMVKGVPTCPNCQRALSALKCEGCSD